MMRSKQKALLRAAADTELSTLRFDSVPLRALADANDATPKWNQLFPLGTFHNGDWPKEGITIDRAFCETVVANWKKRGSPELVVDYFHKTHDESAPKEERVAAGWMEALEARNDGLYARIRWTSTARAAIAAEELRFISPEFHQNGMDGRTGKRQGPTLYCAGLLTDPCFKEMPRVAANDVPPVQPQPAVPEQVMTREQLNAMLKTAGLTLAATATDAEALAALNAHLATTTKTAAEATEALKAKAVTEASEKALKAQLDEAIADKAKIGVRVAQLEKTQFDAKVEALLARAKSEGRITALPALEQVRSLASLVNFEAAAALVDSFAKGAVVQAGPIGHGGAGPEGVDIKGLQAKYDAELDAVLAADKAGVQAASKKVNAKPEYAPLFSKAVINGGSTLN